MKKTILTLLILITSVVFSVAQRFAYVDTEYILSKIPAYEEAQNKLDEMSETWQKEIEAIYGEVEQLYQDFQNNSVLWSNILALAILIAVLTLIMESVE